MLEELAYKSITEKRLDALDRELENIMGNLTGPTVDEIRNKLVKGENSFIEMARYTTSFSRLLPLLCEAVWNVQSEQAMNYKRNRSIQSNRYDDG